MAKSKLLATMAAAGLRPEDDEGVTPGGSDAHINENTEPDQQTPAMPVGPVQPQGAPSLAADLGKTASDRLKTLTDQRTQLNAPLTTKQKIFGGLAAALPTIAGALGGGIYGAAGAAQGTASAIEEARQQKLAQNQQLSQQIEAERGRQEKAADLAAQLEEKRAETAARQQEIAEQIAGRKQTAEIGKKAAAPTIQVGDRLKQWNPDTQKYDIDVGPMAAPKQPPKYELKSGTIDGKPAFVNYDSANARAIDAKGNDVTDKFTPKDTEKTGDDLQKYLDSTAEAQGRPLTAPEKIKAIERYKTIGAQTTFSLNQGPIDPRLSNVPVSQHKDVLDKVQKAEDEHTAAQAATDRMKTVLDLARSGNKEAQASASLVGVQAINELANVKRVNGAEIANYGNAGSLIDSLQGKIGKITAGKPIPDDVLNDMQALHDAFGKNTDSAYQRKLQTIDKTFRSKFATSAAPAATHRFNPQTGKIEAIK